jgi:osmotically inducible protein OsmC
MPIRTADAEWRGNLREGKGHLKLESGAFEGPYNFRARFEDGKDTNPEELLGASHAGCFTMALASGLTKAGHPPTRIHTTAKVNLGQVEGGFAIVGIELVTEAEVPGIDAATFDAQAQGAKAGCPISKALAATPITLTAKLV